MTPVLAPYHPAGYLLSGWPDRLPRYPRLDRWQATLAGNPELVVILSTLYPGGTDQ